MNVFEYVIFGSTIGTIGLLCDALFLPLLNVVNTEYDTSHRCFRYVWQAESGSAQPFGFLVGDRFENLLVPARPMVI